jgi:hypothetical protein
MWLFGVAMYDGDDVLEFACDDGVGFYADNEVGVVADFKGVFEKDAGVVAVIGNYYAVGC